MKKKRSSSTSDFFICFTMRNPSSSKTLASPNHNPNPSLSASLSRRLSLNKTGSHSPMFPSSSSSRRKPGSAIEPAEPSSPKVTCIGQVKIKSKKKNKNKSLVVNRTRSGREASFRRRETKAVSICDAISCFMPASCGWPSCYSSGHKKEKHERKYSIDKTNKNYSCGAVFVRWLMDVEDEEKKDVKNVNEFNELGLFVREKGEEMDLESMFKRKEECVFFEKEEEEEEEEEKEEEEARVSVCIPPKNALLLMRCRSDPVRMAALSTRFWDSPAMKVECKEEVEDEEEEEEEVEVNKAHVEENGCDEEEVEKGEVLDENSLNLEQEKTIIAEEDKELEEVLDEVPKVVEKVVESEVVNEVVEKEMKEKIHCARKEDEREEDEREEVEIVLRRSISCSAPKSNELCKLKEGVKRRSFSYREKKEKRRHSFSIEKEARRHSFCSEKEARRSSFSVDNKESGKRWSFSIEKENLGAKEKPVAVQSVEQTKKEEVPPLKEESMKVVAQQPKIESSKKEETTQVAEKEKKPRELPDCLLLMMYEPKLSMEVSKETWVCSTDFVHWRPDQQPKPKPGCRVEEDINKTDDNCVENENTVSIVPQTPPKPPPTISPMEQKLLKSLAASAIPQAPYNFVLTRCKSEPGKSSARLVPDTCFWKARHQPISTAGIGF